LSTFKKLGLDESLLETLGALGYEEPTPIQREAIPPMVAGRDLLGQAATGTGKTAAFALPMLHRFAQTRASKQKGPRGLVLVPTRELAMQVAEAIQRYGNVLGIRVLPIYGGQAYEQQLRGLKRGVDVVVATPGRALDHLRNNNLGLRGIEVVVLDEADEMLDMGFVEDIEAILGMTPETRQTVMFSATLPPRVASIAKRHLRDPVKVRIAAEPLAKGKVPAVRQLVYVVPRAQKAAALGRLMDVENPTSAIVFCRTRHEVDELVLKLSAQGQRVEPLHGGMSQAQRDRVMKKLRGAAVDLIVATDVAARGLDIERLTHVFNFDVPSAPESYVHRIGRVGRAGREGMAITLAEPRERRMLRNIEQVTGQRLELGKLPTQADMQARRLELTRATLREILVEGNFDRFLPVVEGLAEEFELIDIAMAAIKLAEGQETDADADAALEPAEPREGEPMVRLTISAGRTAGIRPKDLVGAIAGEAGVSSRAIGAIQISDRTSNVEIRESLVEKVIAALSATTLKGQKVRIKRS
jgi:ATP-dependent RNA helicase DeaD